jgi:hypothetical protein
MINVIICETEMDLSFETKIPKIPEKGDKIGAWFNHQWVVCEIFSIIYEFTENGDFHRVEINVISR